MNITYRIENIVEYRQLIFDIITVGAIVRNMYDTKEDEDGLSILTRFETVDVNDLQEYIGLIVYPVELFDRINEYGEEVYAGDYGETIEIKSPNDIQFGECNYEIPSESDFPIIIDWHYEDDFDRFGNIKIRNFLWYPIKNTQRYSKKPFPVLRELWNKRYSEEMKLLMLVQQQNLNHRQNV